MQKPSTLLVLPVIAFHQRLQVTQSSFKGLGELRVSSIHESQIHECSVCTSAIQLRALVVRFVSIHTAFSVRLNIQVPATARVKEQSKCQAQTTRRDRSLGLTENLRNVNIVLTLSKLQQIVSCTTPCLSVETSDLQKLFVGHPSSNSTQQRVIRCVRNSLPLKLTQQTSTRMSSLDMFTSALIGALLGKLPGSDNFTSLNQCARHCRQVARVQHCGLFVTMLMTMMIHHAQQVQTLCLTWKSRVKQVQSCVQQISPFSFCSFASDTERDILSCASLTRALRSASKAMSWMIRVLHCSVWSREGCWTMVDSQPIHPGLYPCLASSTDARRWLALAVLIG